jgi:hypothetical protein
MCLPFTLTLPVDYGDIHWNSSQEQSHNDVFGCNASPWVKWPSGHPLWPERVGIPIRHRFLLRLTFALRRWRSHADLNQLLSRPVISIQLLQQKCSLSRLTRRNRISTQRNRSRPSIRFQSKIKMRTWMTGSPSCLECTSNNVVFLPGCTQMSPSMVSWIKTTGSPRTKCAAKRSSLPARLRSTGDSSVLKSKVMRSIVSILGLTVVCHATDAFSLLR